MKKSSGIDLEEYVPYLLRSTANRLAQATSRIYGEKFDVGLNEWSCLALLATESGISASRICEVSGFDKAVISRSIRSLEAKGLVATESVPNHNRKLLLTLTTKGRNIHDQIMALALKREQMLLKGLSPNDCVRLVRLLKTLLKNSKTLLEREADELSGPNN